ncbi:ribonuclease H-like domain-containing protein [Tanacetum coccineum]
MWHQRLGHPGGDVLRRLVSNNVISCNKEKPPVLCHACQLGKHVRLPFASSNTVVTSCFDIIHSDVWTSPIPSLSGFKYYVLFLDHYSQFVWVYHLLNKSDVLSKFVLFRTYVLTQFKCEIRSFQCDHDGEFDNRNLYKLFAENGSQYGYKSYRDAFHDSNWQNVMRDEYNALIKNQTWTTCTRLRDTIFVRMLGLFCHKYLADDTLSRYKARLVANGSTQLEGVDVDETFSPDCLSGRYGVSVPALTKDHRGMKPNTPYGSQFESALCKDWIDVLGFWSLEPRLISSRILYSFHISNTAYWSSGYDVLSFIPLWSLRQPTLSRSSAEAEYRCVANAVAEICWLRNLLRELHTPLSCATLIYCDNVVLFIYHAIRFNISVRSTLRLDIILS